MSLAWGEIALYVQQELSMLHVCNYFCEPPSRHGVSILTRPEVTAAEITACYAAAGAVILSLREVREGDLADFRKRCSRHLTLNGQKSFSRIPTSYTRMWLAIIFEPQRTTA